VLGRWEKTYDSSLHCIAWGENGARVVTLLGLSVRAESNEMGRAYMVVFMITGGMLVLI